MISMTTRRPGSSATGWSAGQEGRLGDPAQPRRHDVPKLPDTDKAALDREEGDRADAGQPSMIKRPVLDLGGGKLLVGFKPELYAEAFARA